jgi:hypothetical protein
MSRMHTTPHPRTLLSRRRRSAVVLATVLLLAACGGEDDPPAGPQLPDDAALETPSGASDVELLGTEEIVPQIEAAIADAAERFGVDPTTVAVARSLRVTWSDGSLGCPQGDMMYTQALVDGFLLTLEVAGQRVDYHGAMDGEPFLCERD